MDQLISLARALQFQQLTLEQFRSRAVVIICSLSTDELLSIAWLFADTELSDDEYDADNIIKP